MGLIPEALERLAAEFGRLPGIGPKTAQRLSFHCLRQPREVVQGLASALAGLHDGVRTCSECFFIASTERCSLCANPRRDPRVLCVVEEPLDVIAVERSGEFDGLYHVLGGALSPIDGVGPEQLHVAELVARVSRGGVREVIVATDPDVEGEATAHFVAARLAPLGVTVTRLAHGLPAGSNVQYADELTVARAVAERRAL